MSETTKAYVTLLTKTSYLAGALVLNASLKKYNSAYPLVVFATKTLPEDARVVLRSQGIRVREIEYLEPKSSNTGELNEHDMRFADTWTKLRCFELVEYERVVMLDSDMLVLKNMDELLTMDLPKDWIAAAHACACNPRKLSHYPADWTPANCAHTLAQKTIPITPAQFTKPTHLLLNSGLVVLHPSLLIFEKIIETLNFDPIVKTFKFPDQDLLAFSFKDRYLPIGYQYNALKTLRYCHPEMWRDEDVKNVHYILDKPWAARVKPEDTDPNSITHRWWWTAFEELEGNWGATPGWDLVMSTVAKA